jgi:hypothetical protein
MPQQPALAARFPDGLSPPEDGPENRLTDAVSAASLSFVACGAAVADLGELLRELRFALQVSPPRPAGPAGESAAALLAFRLDTVRDVLDETTAAIGGLLAECVPAGARPRRGPACRRKGPQ